MFPSVTCCSGSTLAQMRETCSALHISGGPAFAVLTTTWCCGLHRPHFAVQVGTGMLPSAETSSQSQNLLSNIQALSLHTLYLLLMLFPLFVALQQQSSLRPAQGIHEGCKRLQIPAGLTSSTVSPSMSADSICYLPVMQRWICLGQAWNFSLDELLPAAFAATQLASLTLLDNSKQHRSLCSGEAGDLIILRHCSVTGHVALRISRSVRSLV